MAALPRTRCVLAIAATTIMAAPHARAAPTEPGELQNPLQAPEICQNCHSFPNPPEHENDPFYSPFTWQGTMMANSARDPVFWAGIAIASQDAADLGMPQETELCVRCHAPRAFLDGRGDAIAIDELLPEDLDGVECELCHRMIDDGMTPPGNAGYVIDDVLDNGLVPRRGPWTYPFMGQSPPHSWAEGPLQATSELCGTCHDVTTPQERVDDNGQGLGVSFNEQRTYSEWAASEFAEQGAGFRSCQDCHMPAVEDVTGCSTFLGQVAHPTGGRRHDLVGANRFVLELLKQVYGSAGTDEVDDQFFDVTLERLDEFILTAATLDAQAPDSVDLSVGFDGLEVTVTNETGHKLPTGYSEGRVMWLEIVASYAGEDIYSSGQWQPGVGPEQDAQLRTYEGIADRQSDGTTLHLLLNDHWVEDTRIPPRGLMPDLETDPVGDRYELQMDGTWPNFDVVTYDFGPNTDVVDQTPNDATDDQLEVTIRLLYLVNTPEYIEFLADANRTNDAGSEIAMLFDTNDGAPPLVLAEQTLMIPLEGFGGGSDTGDSSATATDSTSAGTTGGTVDTSGSDTAPGGDDGGGGCGCRSSGNSGLMGSLLPLIVGFRRRYGS